MPVSIPIEQRITALVLSVALLLVILHLIRRYRLREEYALIWLGASLGILVLSVFGGLVTRLAAYFDVSYAPTLILVLGLLFTLVVLLSQSVTLSTQANQLRDLAQATALLEWRLRQLEQAAKTVKTTAEPAADRDGQATPISASTQKGASRSAAGARPAPSKVLVIGLDGATFDLIKPWAAEGYLPALSRLLRQGAHGSLRSTIPPMTAPAWTSFATGANPGKHRLYDWVAREPGTYRFTPVTALDATIPTLYTLLSQAGRRVCTLNVPMTYPPVPVNGVMISGLPAPGTQNTITYPATLYEEIVAATGDYILYPDPGQAYSDSGVDAFLECLYRCTDGRIRVFDHLYGREAWDFGMVVFNGTDTICHALWKYMDGEHPLHDQRRYNKYGTAIRDYYRYLDTYLGRVLDTLEKDTTLLVMSDHGFGPFHKFIHVNNWLIREGFMNLGLGISSRTKQALFRRGFTPMNVYNTLMQLGLGSLKREVVRGQGQGLLKALFLSFADVDWGRTVAYSLGNVGQIYLNVAGREPLGCVTPGPAYERIREEIIERLYTLRDPETGHQVVETVYRREEIYSGDQLEQAPDILFLPRRLEYFGFGEYEFGSHRVIERMKRGISGTHRMDGVFLAYGAAIEPGVTVDDARIIDLAPSILHLMGLPVPAYMDGRVLAEICASGFRSAPVPEQSLAWHHSDNGAAGGLTEAEKQILAERLRNLGYVG